MKWKKYPMSSTCGRILDSHGVPDSTKPSPDARNESFEARLEDLRDSWDSASNPKKLTPMHQSTVVSWHTTFSFWVGWLSCDLNGPLRWEEASPPRPPEPLSPAFQRHVPRGLFWHPRANVLKKWGMKPVGYCTTKGFPCKICVPYLKLNSAR